MNCLLKNANVFQNCEISKKDVLICNGHIVSIGSSIVPDSDTDIIDLNNCFIFPGFIDVHVHLRYISLGGAYGKSRLPEDA